MGSYRGGTFLSALRDTTTSRPFSNGSPKRRRLWRALALLAVVAALLALFAWQEGDEGEGGGPLNAIAAAAERTQGEPGGRARIRALITSPEGSFTMTGRSVYDEHREEGVIEFPNPEDEGMVEMVLVMEDNMMYMRSDAFGSLPDDRSWMGLDLSFGEEPELPTPAAEAKSELEKLESVTGVRKLSKEDVRGVPTTRYAGTVSVSEQVKELREQGADDLALSTEANGAPLQIEVWIDAKELVRRMRMVASQPGEGDEGPTTMDMRMNFFDFGFVPEIEVPDESEVFDMTSMAEEELDSSKE